MREIVEAAVGPTLQRVISLQSNLGDLAEMHVSLSGEVKELKQWQNNETLKVGTISKSVEEQFSKETMKFKK